MLCHCIKCSRFTCFLYATWHFKRFDILIFWLQDVSNTAEWPEIYTLDEIPIPLQIKFCHDFRTQGDCSWNLEMASACWLHRPLQTNLNKIWVVFKFSPATKNTERINFTHQNQKCPSNFLLFQKSFLFIKNITTETLLKYYILCLKEDSTVVVTCCIPAAAVIPSINKLLELLLYKTEYFAIGLILKPEGRNIFAHSFWQMFQN